MKYSIRIIAGLLLGLAVLSSGSALARQDKPKAPKPDPYQKVSDKERVYNISYNQMWLLCLHAANQNFNVESSNSEKGTLEMRTGVSLTSNGFHLSVTVEKADENKTRVKVATTKKGRFLAWGSGGRVTEKFFKAIDEQINPKM